MASKQSANGEDEDPYKTEDGHIELKIENFAGFIQQPLLTKRLSDSVNVRGMPWKILAQLRACDEQGQRQKWLGCYLQCNAGKVFPIQNIPWSCSATAQFKVLAQKEGKVDHVHGIDRVIFNGKRDDWGTSRFMTFEDLMNPDKGFYDQQSDTITLAVDFKTGKATEEFGDYVLIAENELELDTKVSNRFSMQIGHVGWEISFDADQHPKKGEKSVMLSCKDVAKARVDSVMLELFGYHRYDPNSVTYSALPTAYSALPTKSVHCHLFTSRQNSLTVKIPGGCANILFTIRVYKERSQFPDFTNKATTKIGRFPADVILRVGDQNFHVNKQLISSLSPFFDRNFNGVFDAAKQQELELSLEMHSTELLHHFLLVMFNNEALPNSINVTALFKLADFYDAENVRQKCDQHLRMAREIPIVKRMLLALDHGNEETRTLIMDNANFVESKLINRLLVKHYPTKH